MTSTGAASHDQTAALVRLFLFVVIAAGEMALTSWLFDYDAPRPHLEASQYLVRQAILVGVAASVAFAVMCWPRRQVLLASWLEHVRPGGWRVPLLVNFALFSGVAVATIAFSAHVSAHEQVSWHLYGAYLALLGSTGLSLIWVAAPVGVWREIHTSHIKEIVVAVGIGLLAVVAAAIAQSGWSVLAGLTLQVTHAMLSFYESAVQIDYESRILAVGNFRVHVADSCSGYEGIGLVTVFLALFLWTFRKTLRFPNAFVLLPAGVVAIWLLNSARLAALVSIGAHLSPEVAVSGFHSQAGWMAFLVVTIAIMAVVPRLAFFAAEGSSVVVARQSASDRVIIAYLAPFMCLMATSIIMGAFVPYDAWFHVLRVVSVAACLWIFRDVYAGLIAKVQPLAVACGVLIGILWIATAPATPDGDDLAAWIGAQPTALVVLWLVIRAIGTVIMVPIAEELAFRGLLHRWLISRRFETVDFAQFTWLAFVVSSLLFGLMHQRWIEGALSGGAFALLMYRSGRLSDPIAAHMAANAVIVAWAIAARDWSLL